MRRRKGLELNKLLKLRDNVLNLKNRKDKDSPLKLKPNVSV